MDMHLHEELQKDRQPKANVVIAERECDDFFFLSIVSNLFKINMH